MGAGLRFAYSLSHLTYFENNCKNEHTRYIYIYIYIIIYIYIYIYIYIQ